MNVPASTSTLQVWDPVVRIGHWILVTGFFVAYFTDDDFLVAHVWAGYVVGAVIVIRVAWGFVGPTRARFSDFVCGPREVVGYLRALPGHRAKR